MWQREGTGWRGGLGGGSELRHSPRPPRTLLEHGHPREAGGSQKAPREPVPSMTPFSRGNAPQEPPTPPRPEPAHPTGPSRASLPGSCLQEPSLDSLCCSHIPGFQSPSPTGQGVKAWEEPPVAPPALKFAPRRRGSGAVTSRATSRHTGWSWRQRGSAVTGTELFLPRALPTGIVTKGAIPGTQLWCRSLGAAPQKRT